jgi:formamidopyrimidine-DNA glycosylase
MPELIEVELYRRLAARTVGRRISSVCSPDAWYLKGGIDAAGVEAAVVGATVGAARRIGKLLALDLHVAGGPDRPTLGLRFGMTGRLLVDGDAAIGRLEYGSARAVPAWDRFRLGFEGGGDLVMRDPRRLGGVFLDVDEDRLGRDAASIDAASLTVVLGAATAPLKVRLMDQRRLAGLGNLLTDEILWRAGLAPGRAAGSLSPAERRRLAAVVRSTVEELTARGGSHTGDLQAARKRGGRCPRDGEELRRETVGGRTTYWCPRHQA